MAITITIEQREHHGTPVLVVTGRMTLTECRGQLRSTVRELLERGRKHLIVDLEAVPFLDSAGLGELVSSYASLAQLGGSLKLVNVNARVLAAIDATGLSPALQQIELPETEPVHTR
jgi:anti-anti-sigma factor